MEWALGLVKKVQSVPGCDARCGLSSGSESCAEAPVSQDSASLSGTTVTYRHRLVAI